jgi:hypothetical protein
VNAIVILSRSSRQSVTSNLSADVALRMAMEHDLAHPHDLVSVIDLSTGDLRWNNQQFYRSDSGAQGNAASSAA